MKILTVCSGNIGDVPAPFITEQMESIRQIYGAEIDYFLIEGRGYKGYLKNFPRLIKQLRAGNYDLIHAHYGLSALLANLQRRIPVVATFHGCDVNDSATRPFSWLAYLLSARSIFVGKLMTRWFSARREPVVIPCGIDLSVFRPIPKQEARHRLNLDPDKKYALFSSAFSVPVKNYGLARQAVERLGTELEIIELKGYSREEVCLLLNAVDLALLTSIREGSPQFIKEAMACNCPTISTDVGDVRNVFAASDGCFLCDSTPASVAEAIQKALNLKHRTDGREQLLAQNLDLPAIARQIREVYQSLLPRKSRSTVSAPIAS